MRQAQKMTIFHKKHAENLDIRNIVFTFAAVNKVIQKHLYYK